MPLAFTEGRDVNRGRDCHARTRAERMDEREVREFCGEVAVLPVLSCKGRGWQARSGGRKVGCFGQTSPKSGFG